MLQTKHMEEAVEVEIGSELSGYIRVRVLGELSGYQILTI